MIYYMIDAIFESFWRWTGIVGPITFWIAIWAAVRIKQAELQHDAKVKTYNSTLN